ncbi:MAG: hypothetical protein NTZ78_01675 [Candidatus Aureabacteria bacterium]|nr:hypothetical protein [Candidatus Auribacterota bacterium]
MKCPDKELLARLLDGEEVAASGTLRAHIQDCELCQKRARDEGELGSLIRAFFKKTTRDLVRDAAPCPSPEEIALYAEGRAPLYRKQDLMRHFCACPSCARAVLDVTASRGNRLENPPTDLVREAGAVYRRGKDSGRK